MGRKKNCDKFESLNVIEQFCTKMPVNAYHDFFIFWGGWGGGCPFLNRTGVFHNSLRM